MHSSDSDNDGDELLRPYQSKNPLTKTEIMFYQRLTDALPDLVVLAQVPLSSFLKVDSTQIDPKFSKRWFSPISQQSVDYLICRKDFSIVAAVELDDKTHLSEDAIKRDNKKNHNLAAANVPLIRWHAESMPDKQTILKKVLELSSATQPTQKTEAEWQAEDQQRYFKYSRKKSTGSLSYLLKEPLLEMLLKRPSTTPCQKNKSDWLADAQELSSQYVKRKLKGLLVFSLIVLIPIGIVIWLVLSTINHVSHMGKHTDQLLQAPEINSATTLTNSEPPINIEQQSLPTPEQKVREQQALLRAQQVQDQLKREKEADLEVLKEETWNREFKTKDECSANESMVECGNKHIRNRKKFDAYWEAKKARLATEP